MASAKAAAVPTKSLSQTSPNIDADVDAAQPTTSRSSKGRGPSKRSSSS